MDDTVFDLMDAGRYKDALRAWNAPGQAQGGHIRYNNGGTLHLLLRDYEGARRCFEKSVAIGPKVRSTHEAEGCALSLWLAGDRQGAIARQQKLVDNLDAGKIDYASDLDGLGERLRLAALHVLASDIDRARKLIDHVKETSTSTHATRWPIVVFLKGQSSADNLLTRMRRGSNGKPKPSLLAKRPMCVAEFYVGISHLMKREPKEARAFFRKAVARHAILEGEWFLAREAAEAKARVSHG